jgi:hypothetical protein
LETFSHGSTEAPVPVLRESDYWRFASEHDIRVTWNYIFGRAPICPRASEVPQKALVQEGPAYQASSTGPLRTQPSCQENLHLRKHMANLSF